MRLWHRKGTRSADEPRDDDRLAPSDSALRPLYDSLAGYSMPASLTPRLDPGKTKVFDDEVDPSSRDRETAE